MTDYTKWVGFDVETAGELPEYALQPYRLARGQAHVTSFATAWFEPGSTDRLVTDAVADPTIEHYRQLLNTAYEQGLTLVGWNVAFDAAWLVAAGLRNEVLRCEWLDGMLLWQHLEREPEYEMSAAARRPWGLKAAVERYYPVAAGYDEGVDFQDMSPEAVAKRLTYNRMDAQFALALARSFHQALRERDPRLLRNAMIERAAIPMVADSMVQGLVVDRKAADELGRELVGDTRDLLEQLEAEGASDKVLRSPVQLRKLLYETWGMPIEHLTDKGAPSTDKVALHYLSLEDPRPQMVKDYREAIGNHKKFVENVVASADYNEDGKTRPAMRIYGAYTGRAIFASKQGRGKAERQTGFAIHQMKNDKRYRNIIAAPEGFVLCELDAAGQEFRWMAEESGDETMRSLCMPGEDPHSYMGASIIHMDYHRMMELKEIEDEAKHGRKMGKVGNLSCVTASTEILTDSGPKRIVDVAPSDKVWDGVEFVTHGGVIFNGYRETITYSGLSATPDHKVLCRGEWVDFGVAAVRSWAIDKAGRPVGDHRDGDGPKEQAGSGTLSVPVRHRSAGDPADAALGAQPGVCEVPGAQDPHHAGALLPGYIHRQSAAEARGGNAVSLRQPQRPLVPELRRSWDRIQVCLGSGGCGAHQVELAAPYVQSRGPGPHRQQRPLRPRQLAADDSVAEFAEYAQHHQGSVAGAVGAGNGLGREPVFGDRGRALCSAGAHRRGDSDAGRAECSREAQGVAEDTGPAPVYDILNCGPRHRFAANGLIVHNCQFRIGWKKLRLQANVQFGMPIGEREAQHIHKTYHSTYPGVKQYWNRQTAKCRRLGYAETLAGRRVQLKGSWTSQKTGWKLESTAVNFPIQGIGADQKYLAIKVMSNLLPQMGGYFYFELHDGIYFLLPEKTARRDALVLQQALNNLPYQRAWGFTPSIPFPWDLKIGTSWGNMKEVTG